MNPQLRKKLAAALGSTVAHAQQVSGGDINDAFDVKLHDGRRVLVKTHARAPARMYACEAAGLQLLGEPGSLRVPAVLAHSEADATGPAYLALELIEARVRRADFDETLGRGLAALHRALLPSFGLDHDNYIAILPQDNAPCASFREFYAQRRLLPMLKLATDRGRATGALRGGVERVCARLATWIANDEPPSRLHGDLWGGNLLVDDQGAPCLIDPAVYGGARELDLAMMRLFGGFSERVFSAYDEAYPLATDHEERVALYQLYPVLVHVSLFGGGYVAQAERLLRSLI